MNLLEHYILEIHSEKDVTELFEERCGYRPEKKIYEIEMDVICYGVKEHVKKIF